MDKGRQFCYAPMQDQNTLARLGVTPEECEQGMILINAEKPVERWQGSDAAEEIGNQMPFGEAFVNLYRSLPGIKSMGDRTYEQIRDNRYSWFGKRTETYQSEFPICSDSSCAKYFQ
jgi:predicted DCC family thiol-disulfide oxidoreductase YuxK